MSTLELDCRGMLCPRPVIELGRRLPEVQVGDTIDLASDDVAAAADIPAWCRMRGQELVGVTTAEDGVPVYQIRRTS